MSLSSSQLRERLGPVPEITPTPPAPQSDRRNAQRIRQAFHAEIAPWHVSHTGPVFNVLVQDISTTGLRILHSGRLEIGAKYLLEIPRPGKRPVGVVFTVVHCDESDGGGEFAVQLEPDDVLDLTTRAALMQHQLPEKASNGLIGLVVLAIFAAAATLVYLFK